jgi:chloride channel, nucleotide-sensitive, 1A
MLPTVIKSRPSAANDFLPLSEYQAQTPDTFFESKPVLYFHDENIKAWCSSGQHERLYFFSGESSARSLQPTSPESHALEAETAQQIREEDRVEVFVASKYVSHLHI